MTIASVYTEGFHKQMKYYFAQWTPNSPLALGVVGELIDRHYFRPQSTLVDLGIPFNPETDIVSDADPSPMDFTSHNGVTINLKLAGEENPLVPSIPKASVGLGIRFGREGAFVLKAEAMFEPRIRNTLALHQAILEAYKRGAWPDNRCVIWSLVTAPYADILISESTESNIELQATGDVANPLLALGRADIQLGVKRSSGSVMDFRGSKNVTPAFQLLGIKRALFGGTRIGNLRLGYLPEGPGSRSMLQEVENGNGVYLDLLTADTSTN